MTTYVFHRPLPPAIKTKQEAADHFTAFFEAFDKAAVGNPVSNVNKLKMLGMVIASIDGDDHELVANLIATNLACKVTVNGPAVKATC